MARAVLGLLQNKFQAAEAEPAALNPFGLMPNDWPFAGCRHWRDPLGVSRRALQALQVAPCGCRFPAENATASLTTGLTSTLDETYNASPDAVLAALELLAAQPGRRFAVLGTMLELGDRSLELHQEVAARAVQLGLDGLVLVDGGAEGKAMAEFCAF